MGIVGWVFNSIFFVGKHSFCQEATSTLLKISPRRSETREQNWGSSWSSRRKDHQHPRCLCDMTSWWLTRMCTPTMRWRGLWSCRHLPMRREAEWVPPVSQTLLTMPGPGSGQSRLDGERNLRRLSLQVISLAKIWAYQDQSPICAMKHCKTAIKQHWVSPNPL